MRVLSECNLSEIISDFLNGEVVVFPTETSYGLGTDATNQSAVDKIFKIKKRDENKSLLVVVPDALTAKKYLVWNEQIEKLSSAYWPGPLTIVGEAAPSNLAKGVISIANTLAVRVSAFPFLNSVTKMIGRPIVATSANIAGGGDCYDVEEVLAVFKEEEYQPDIILDSGKLEKHLPSTIVSVVGGKLTILRQGELRINL